MFITRSLCVIPFDFIKPDNINILHWAKKSQHVISFFAIPYSAYPCESIYVNEN